ncbi:hypothetical protein ACFL1H_06120, partial [Nanoarchaeota archaeon]
MGVRNDIMKLNYMLDSDLGKSKNNSNYKDGINELLYSGIILYPKEINAVKVHTEIDFRKNRTDISNNTLYKEDRNVIQDYIQKYKDEAVYDKARFTFVMHLPYQINQFGELFLDMDVPKKWVPKSEINEYSVEEIEQMGGDVPGFEYEISNKSLINLDYSNHFGFPGSLKISLSDRTDITLFSEEILKIEFVKVEDNEYSPIYNGYSEELTPNLPYIANFVKSRGFNYPGKNIEEIKRSVNNFDIKD